MLVAVTQSEISMGLLSLHCVSGCDTVGYQWGCFHCIVLVAVTQSEISMGLLSLHCVSGCDTVGDINGVAFIALC